MTQPSTKQDTGSESQRLDKWLWAARFYKTRTLAQKAITHNQILVNGQKANASRTLVVGLFVTVKSKEKTCIYEVKGINQQRRPYVEAKELYEETQESLAKNQALDKERASLNISNIAPKPDHRPDKKSRRKLRDIKRNLE